MKLYDCHIHSEYSIDGKDTIEDIINTAIKKGVSAITITDHALPFHPDYKNYEHIKKSTDETKRLAEKYKDKILVLSGVERDDEYPPDYLEPFYDFNLDCILGSALASLVSCITLPNFTRILPTHGHPKVPSIFTGNTGAPVL